METCAQCEEHLHAWPLIWVWHICDLIWGWWPEMTETVILPWVFSSWSQLETFQLWIVAHSILSGCSFSGKRHEHMTLIPKKLVHCVKCQSSWAFPGKTGNISSFSWVNVKKHWQTITLCLYWCFTQRSHFSGIRVVAYILFVLQGAVLNLLPASSSKTQFTCVHMCACVCAFEATSWCDRTLSCCNAFLLTAAV